MKRLYFLLSIIIMFSLNIFSGEKKRTLDLTEWSLDQTTDDSNKRRKLESNSILSKAESKQFAEDFKSGELQKSFIDQYKEYKKRGLLEPGRRTRQEKENVNGLLDILTMLGVYHNGELVEQEPLESLVKVEHTEEKISLVLYDSNSNK